MIIFFILKILRVMPLNWRSPPPPNLIQPPLVGDADFIRSTLGSEGGGYI